MPLVGQFTSSEVPGEAARRAAFERLAWAEAFTRVRERLAMERGAGETSAPVKAMQIEVNRI